MKPSLDYVTVQWLMAGLGGALIVKIVWWFLTRDKAAELKDTMKVVDEANKTEHKLMNDRITEVKIDQREICTDQKQMRSDFNKGLERIHSRIDSGFDAVSKKVAS